MLVQAEAEAVDKGHSANVQRRLVHVRCTGAVGLKAARNDPQKNAQHHVEHGPVTLHKVTAQPSHRTSPVWTVFFHGEPATRARSLGFAWGSKPVPGCDTVARAVEWPIRLSWMSY